MRTRSRSPCGGVALRHRRSRARGRTGTARGRRGRCASRRAAPRPCARCGPGRAAAARRCRGARSRTSVAARVVGDQLGAPAFGLVQRERSWARPSWRSATRCASGSTSASASACRSLHLAAPRLVARDAPCARDRVEQGLVRPRRRAASSASRPAPRRAPAARATASFVASCSAAACARRSSAVAASSAEVGGGRGAVRQRGGKANKGRRYHNCSPSCPDRTSLPALASRSLPHAHQPPRPPAQSGFAYSREQFRELVDDAPGARQGARRERRRRRGVRRRGPVGLGAQGRDSRTSSATATSRWASPSTSASGAATRAPPTSRAPRSSRRCGRPTTSPASRRKTRPPACPMPTTSPTARQHARPGPVPSLGHRRRAGGRDRARAARRAALAVDQRITNSRRRRRLGAAVALLRRQHARLSRRLCQLAPFALGGADRRPARRRRHAARRLVQLDARGRRAGRARSGRPLRRRARAGAADVAQDPTCEVPVLFESPLAAGPAGRLRAGDQRRRAVSQVVLPGRQPGQAGVARAHRRRTRIRTSARQGQRAVRRRRRAHAAAQGGRRAASSKAISCRAIRRASWACRPPATPAARTT